MSTTPAALVTGGSRGIGKAIALELARTGHAVAVNYVRSGDAADAVVSEMQSLGVQSVAVQGDVASAADRERMLNEMLEAFGRIDVLVNNAGITSPGRKDLLEVEESGWDTVFDTNLKGPFFLAQAAAKEMLKREASEFGRGKIINISSISAYAVSTNRTDYCITKAAMGMLTQVLAARLADEGINVFEICPGVIASDMTAPVQEKYDKLIADGLSPIRRWGQPEDVARAISAIVQNFFPFSTGQRINVDGGFHIRRL